MSEQSKINVMRGRKLSLEGAKLMGQGATCSVYALPDDNVVKVLNTADMKDAEREIQLAKWAFAKGIPTAISYDVVDVNGHPGLVYESLGRGNLRNELRDKPDQFYPIMERYLAFIKNLNSIIDEEGLLPSTKQQFFNKLLTVKKYVTPEEYERITMLVNTIPESNHVIHGDCHIKNLRVLNNQLYIIDLDTLSVGNPIFELMGICCCYKGYHNDDGNGYNYFLEIDYSVVDRTYDYIMNGYFENISDEQKKENTKKVELLTYIYMMYCLNPDNPEEKDQFDDMYSRVQKDLYSVNDFILDC